MDIFVVLLLTLFSLVVGIVASMIGLGGGFLIVPMLVLGFGLPAQKAVGTSLMAITFTSLSSTIGYAMQRRIDYQMDVWLDVLDIPGVAIGAYITTLLSSNLLTSIFGAFLVSVAFFMIRHEEAEEEACIRVNRTG